MFKDKKNVFLIILAVIILVGIIMFCIKDLNYNLFYGKNTTISITTEQAIDKSELQQIVEETIGGKVSVRNLNDLSNSLLITIKGISDEQKTNLLTKVNEKYSLELKEEDLEITNNASIKLIDIIKPYITPSVISIVLILAYFIIRYRKYGIGKIILETLGSILISELSLFSIYAIVRIPVNSITMPISVILFVIVIIALMEKYRKEELKRKQSQKKK